MKNLILIFMMLFAIDSIAQLDQRERADVLTPALNTNPHIIQKTGWTVTQGSGCDAPSYSKTRVALTCTSGAIGNGYNFSETLTYDKLNEMRALNKSLIFQTEHSAIEYGEVRVTVYRITGADTTTLSSKVFSNNASSPSKRALLSTQVNASDLVSGNSIKIEITVTKTSASQIMFGQLHEGRLYVNPMEHSPLIHEVREESGMSLIGTVPFAWSGTNGTKGTTSRDEMWCGRQGQFMRLSFKYNNASGGTAGTGNISLSIPTSCAGDSGLTVDTAATPIVGSFQANIVGFTPEQTIGTIRTNYSGNEISLFAEGNRSLLNITTGGSYFLADVLIPITQWKQSSLSISSQNDISDPKNHAIFGFTVTGIGNLSQVYGEVPVSVTNIENGYNSIAFSGLTEAPVCLLTPREAATTNNMYSARWSGGLTNSGGDIKVLTASNTLVNITVMVSCTKTGQDYIDAWKKTATAYLKESMIEKDVEQFHADERKICDRCWKGKALYKKCYEGSAGSGYVLTSEATDFKRCYGHWSLTATRQLPISLDSGANFSFCELNPSTGALILEQDETRNVSFCAEYSKD